MQTNSFRR